MSVLTAGLFMNCENRAEHFSEKIDANLDMYPLQISAATPWGKKTRKKNQKKKKHPADPDVS